jgi:hypothetical protein
MYVYKFNQDLTDFERRLRGTDMDEDFTEFVRLSKNWKELVRRCGYEFSYSLTQRWKTVLKQKVLSLGLDTKHFTYRQRMPQMYQVSVQEFKEYVCLSHSWSELARRCGQPTKFGRCCSNGVMNALKKKVMFLKLDIQHFGKCGRVGEAGEAGVVGEVGESGEMGEKVVQMGENGREILKTRDRAEIPRLPLVPPPFDWATSLEIVKQMEMTARQQRLGRAGIG